MGSQRNLTVFIFLLNSVPLFFKKIVVLPLNHSLNIFSHAYYLSSMILGIALKIKIDYFQIYK